ncbi:FeS assembly ATPase SufC [Staphylococcus aureus]|nr:FeS assembly ATPase SufC [Staphylococcus aureus]
MLISCVSAINAKREEGQEINLMQFIKKLDKNMDFLDIDKRTWHNVI